MTRAQWEAEAVSYREQLGWLIDDGDDERAYQLARHVVSVCPFIACDRIEGARLIDSSNEQGERQ